MSSGSVAPPALIILLLPYPALPRWATVVSRLGAGARVRKHFPISRYVDRVLLILLFGTPFRILQNIAKHKNARVTHLALPSPIDGSVSAPIRFRSRSGIRTIPRRPRRLRKLPVR